MRHDVRPIGEVEVVRVWLAALYIVMVVYYSHDLSVCLSTVHSVFVTTGDDLGLMAARPDIVKLDG